MRKYTQVVVRSMDCGDSGFPKKIGIYHIGEPRQQGDHFDVPVLVVLEKDLHIPRPPAESGLTSAAIARELAVLHFREYASQSKLEIVVTELPELAR